MSNRTSKLSALLMACFLHPFPSSCQVKANTTTYDVESSGGAVHKIESADFNQKIYYRNKLELSVESGWLPINIPFVFDFLTSGAYNKTPLEYTLVPTIVSLRWQMGNIGGPSFLRGSWDFTASGAVTIIPRGPETHAADYMMGIRRNFVYRNWRVAPYLEGRVGTGYIDAKGPMGVKFAQGQDLTFTLNLGAGVRYNFNPKYSISTGMTYMHVSNLYMSEPKYRNYGINVYGPVVGFSVRLGKPKRASLQ